MRAAGAPLRRFFDPRFAGLDEHLQQVRSELDRLSAEVAQGGGDPDAAWRVRQSRLLERVDLARHELGAQPRPFASLVSQAPSAAHFAEPELTRWLPVVDPDGVSSRCPQRKHWEWALVLQAAHAHGLMVPGRRALGFGVGKEPVPAGLAAAGVEVLATDQDVERGATSADWAQTDQHLRGLSDLLRPDLLPDEDLAALVRVQALDMNDAFDELGTVDLVWSSCALEHLGSPAAGLDFVRRSCRLLTPGGVAVHTTELELTDRTESADYGHCAVYVLADLQRLAATLREDGLEIELSSHVSMATPRDRTVSTALLADPDLAHEPAHLKLVIGDSVSTSFGLVVRRPS